MDQKVDRHEKIRFGPADFAGLETFPSAAGDEHLIVKRRRKRSFMRWVAGAAGALTSLIVIAGIGIFFLGVYGISTERVHARAEAALREALGADVDLDLGPARLTFGGAGLVSVVMEDIRLGNHATGQPIIEAGALESGVRILPLLSGQVEFSSARVSDATINLAAMPETGGTDILLPFKNSDGLVQPEKLVEATFSGTRLAFASLSGGQAPNLELNRVSIVMPGQGDKGSGGKVIQVSDARFQVADGSVATLTADAEFNGRTVSVEGEAKRDAVSQRVSDLKVDASISALPGEPDPESQDDRFGQMSVAISGAEGIGGTSSRLAINAKLGQSKVWVDKRNFMEGSFDIAVAATGDRDRVEIEKLGFVNGRSDFDFNGAVGPRPAEDGRQAHYKFELVSDRSISAPADSSEPALEFVARAAGYFDPATQVLAADEIGLRTSGGELTASAAVDFEPGLKPGMRIKAHITQMPVTHAKQLWPFIAAPGARRWALNRLFGGIIADSSLQYQVEPGRIGNGVPLTHDEVFGKFSVSDTRFDVTGDIPPVRDAEGTIEFHGNDVDVKLASGTSFLPSGRFVETKGGTLQIRNATQKEVVGALDLNIEGDAQAIAELASVEPINGLQKIGFVPDDFSGRATGNIKAGVPIFGVTRSVNELGWKVSLNYTDLSLAKPIDGQSFTDADGTIEIDPDKAVISARAQLNGAPAEVDLVEPFGDSDIKRDQNIVLVLNDVDREKFVPGLGDFLSGTIRVGLDMTAKDKRAVEIDLAKAKLMIPWAGWSKGAGIAGKMSFILETDGDTSRLSDIELRGKSFSIDGSATLDKGSLRSGRFRNVQLNRGDDADIDIDRSGKTLKVSIKGSSFDVRSVINQLTEDAEGTAKSATSGSVNLTAALDSITGFHGEQLRGVKVSYKGVGSRIDGLDASATTASGAPVRLVDQTDGGRRATEMQSTDAGAVLRFLNIYQHMEGGTMKFALAGDPGGTMRGQIDAMNFWVVNEPKLASIVSTPPRGDNQSLNQAVKKDIDTSRVKFERGYAMLEKGPGRLALQQGVLRGPLIGATFQGQVYDNDSNINMTGTFMPAYGLNRIFGEIPLVGVILGNGRDRGLIGVTFRLHGKAAEPDLQINPLSIVAPGIFRSIFEFR